MPLNSICAGWPTDVVVRQRNVLGDSARPETGTSIEIRRRGPATRMWEPEPGEAHLSSTGELGVSGASGAVGRTPGSGRATRLKPPVLAGPIGAPSRATTPSSHSCSTVSTATRSVTSHAWSIPMVQRVSSSTGPMWPSEPRSRPWCLPLPMDSAMTRRTPSRMSYWQIRNRAVRRVRTSVRT